MRTKITPMEDVGDELIKLDPNVMAKVCSISLMRAEGVRFFGGDPGAEVKEATRERGAKPSDRASAEAAAQKFAERMKVIESQRNGILQERKELKAELTRPDGEQGVFSYALDAADDDGCLTSLDGYGGGGIVHEEVM